MYDTTKSKVPARFPLTIRQRRLRYLTAIVLVIIALMIVFGAFHPAFRMTPPSALTDPLHPIPAPQVNVIRHAFAVKLLFIGAYWAACIVLTLLLPVFAWFYTQDIQMQELMARRDIWRGERDTADNRRDDGQDIQPAVDSDRGSTPDKPRTT